VVGYQHFGGPCSLHLQGDFVCCVAEYELFARKSVLDHKVNISETNAIIPFLCDELCFLDEKSNYEFRIDDRNGNLFPVLVLGYIQNFL